jgi:hypothetical protein
LKSKLCNTAIIAHARTSSETQIVQSYKRHWRIVENAILVRLLQATLVCQPLKGFITTTDLAGEHRKNNRLMLARKTA